jgi:8-oxo-dGTP pyrophosphatase MutT (NUDIX family)
MDYSEQVKKLFKLLKQTPENVDVQAAVVVLLKFVNQDFQVLLVKRAEKLGDPWSGQTALPGGKRNSEDQNPNDTLVRETLEETGINLLVSSRFLGTIEPIMSTQKPEMKILPFVVLQEKPQKIKLNEELTEYFWTPLMEFTKNKGTFKFGLEEHPAYVLENCVVWGLTYRILDKLLGLVYSIEKQ